MPGVITLIEDDRKTLESVFKKLEKAEPADIPALLHQGASPVREGADALLRNSPATRTTSSATRSTT